MNNNITIRTDVRHGDAGYITYMHGKIYGEEYGYSTIFEAYVAESFYQFLKNCDPVKDRLWCAEDDGRIVGCIGIVSHGDRAQLRWFLLEKEYRGMGLGRKLLESAVAFAKDTGYGSIYLDTTTDLTDAIALYERAGFRKVKETPNDAWHKGTMEAEYEMVL